MKAAEHGRAAVSALRPRGIGGLVRSRPPLALLLWLAGIQGLIVLNAPDELAVLEPPGGGARHPRPSRRAAACRAVDQWWELQVFASVPVVLLAAAALLAVAAPGLTPAVLVLVLIVLGWTAVWLLTGVARVSLFLYQAFERSPRRSPDLARSGLHPHWQLALVHTKDPPRVRDLIDETLRLVDDLAAAAPDRRTEDEAGVVCRQDAVTTDAARRVLLTAGRVEELPGPVVVTVLREPTHQLQEPGTVGGAGISVILLGLATTMAVLPVLVAGSERQACGGGLACQGRPTGYGAALSWLLPFVDDDTVHAATLPTKVLGWLFVGLLVVVTVCLVVAVRRTAELTRTELAAVHGQVSGSALPAPVWAGPGPSVEPAIFLNYRKEDGGWVVAIHRYLADSFEGVFRDSHSIRAGEDFEQALLGAVRTTRVVLAVIGPGWVDARTPDGRRRLEDEDDWVRREMAEAFRHDVPVVPVLVDGAARLTDADLPADIAAIRKAQYVDLRHRTDPYDLAKLADQVQELVPDLRRRAEDGGRARSRAEIDAFLRANLPPQQQRAGHRDHLVEVLAATVGRAERLLAVAPCRFHSGPAVLVVTDRQVRPRRTRYRRERAAGRPDAGRVVDREPDPHPPGAGDSPLRPSAGPGDRGRHHPAHPHRLAAGRQRCWARRPTWAGSYEMVRGAAWRSVTLFRVPSGDRGPVRHLRQRPGVSRSRRRPERRTLAPADASGGVEAGQVEDPAVHAVHGGRRRVSRVVGGCPGSRRRSAGRRRRSS